MILEELRNFYCRTVKESGAPVAAAGFERRRIPFVIVLDCEGRVVTLEDTRSGKAGDENGSFFMVPKGVKKTSGVSPNLLWDNCSYVLGYPKPGLPKHAQKHASQAKDRQRSFIALIRDRFEEPVQDAGIRAVLLFLERGDYLRVYGWDKWREVEQGCDSMTFRLYGDDCLVCQRPAVISSLQMDREVVSGEQQRCLVTGARAAPVRIHTAIRGVFGTLRSGANVVSFGKDAFCSFGLKQGNNAPIGKEGEFAYTTALNLLLDSPRHRLHIADATAVFWSEGRSVFEEVFAGLFTDPKYDPDWTHAAIQSLRHLGQSCTSGGEVDEGTFFLLAMAPNAARIAVRLWYRGSVTKTAENVVRHFEDCRIVHLHGLEHLAPSQLLCSIAPRGQDAHMESQLACELMRSILSGCQYPQALLISALRRCRCQGGVTHARAALIKGVLVRQTPEKKPTISIGLDTGNSGAGYLLGRFFSIIQRVQETAIKGIECTISDRYFGPASCTPALVFPHLVKLKNHLLPKIGNAKVQKLLGQLANELQEELHGYPGHLPLHEQAHFALGYYHQRHALTYPEPLEQRSSNGGSN